MSTGESAQNNPLDNEAVNKAALEYSLLAPQIRGRANTLKGKALARVFTAVMEFPLAEKEVKFRSKEEHELFILCLQAQTHKQTMVAAVFQNQAMLQEIEEKAVDGIVEEVLESKEKGDE